MTKMENALRSVMDSLICCQPGLQRIDESLSIDDNMIKTGVDEGFVKSFLMGRRALREEGVG